MAKNKSVSLFEVLPPSSSPKESAPQPAAAAPKPEPTKSRRDNTPQNPVAEAPSPSFSSTSNLNQHQTAGVSVREKNDNFYYIAFGMACAVIVSGLLGFRLGQNSGFKEGQEAKLRQMTMKNFGTQKPSQASIESVTPKSNNNIQPASILPTSIKPLSPAKAKILAPKSNYKVTVQVQSFLGHNKLEETKALVSSLKSDGYDAFADYKRGIVYVGRFTSLNAEANRLKTEISRYRWNKRNFSGVFLNKYPTNL
ncbi:MAG: hypothetical protein HQL32_06430 [Planctomycetes bacterium]|nr:hypothetical protein [Planctomycetota bacterium]